ncbi:MAG: transglutaminase-like domain-containing protein [Planctomycetia bacterium]|nr:transglutaminase-like domain-containing protein [Planctomycetia bacterium]
MKARHYIFILTFVLLSLYTGFSYGQFKDESETVTPGGAPLGESIIEYWESGVELNASRGECKNVRAVVPVPTNWKEQKVKLVKEDISPLAKISFRDVKGGGKMLMINIPVLPARAKEKVILRYEIECFATEAPSDTSIYQKAENVSKNRDLRLYLQPSPKIESKDKKITKLAKTIGVDAENAWKEVEAVYDWVREEIKYENGPQKGALAALKDKTGDCEELTALFVGICRAKGIPARVVWVPGHCYAEFYLVDAEGNGHWFPCQTAGDRAFGEMPFQYIILQKGDSFETLLDKKPVKVPYIPVQLKSLEAQPHAKFITEKVVQ